MSNDKFLKKYEKVIKKMENKNKTSKNGNNSKISKENNRKGNSYENPTENLFDDYIFNYNENNENLLSEQLDDIGLESSASIQSNTESNYREAFPQNDSQTIHSNIGSNIYKSHTKLIIIE